MPALMGQHIHIAGCAVPVRKDKGRFIVRDNFLISAAHLARAAHHIKHFVVLHEVDERTGHRAEFVVHLAGACHQFLIIAMGRRVSICKIEGTVPEHRMFKADPLGFQRHDFCKHRHHVNGHFIAKSLDLFWPIADPVHPHIAQLAVIFIAEHPGLFIAIVNQLVIDAVKFLPVRIKISGFRVISGPAHCRVHTFFIQVQLRNGQLLTVQCDKRTAIQFLVCADQGIFFLLQRYQPFIHCLDPVLQRGQHRRAKRISQSFGVRVGQNRFCNACFSVGNRRAVLIKPILFS